MNIFFEISTALSNNSKKILGYFLIIISAMIGFTLFYSLIFFNIKEQLFNIIVLLSSSITVYSFGLFLIRQNTKINELVTIANSLQYINFYISYEKLSIKELVYMIFVLDVYYYEEHKSSLLIECNWKVQNGMISNELVEALIYSYLNNNFNNSKTQTDLIVIERILKNVNFLNKFIKNYKNQDWFNNPKGIPFLIPIDKNTNFQISDYYKK